MQQQANIKRSNPNQVKSRRRFCICGVGAVILTKLIVFKITVAILLCKHVNSTRDLLLLFLFIILVNFIMIIIISFYFVVIIIYMHYTVSDNINFNQ